MAVVNNHLSQIAQLPLSHLCEELMIAWIPGGLVVDQHLNVLFASDGTYRDRVVQGCGKRFFNHGTYAMERGALNHFSVIRDGGVHENRIGMPLGEHPFDVCVEQLGV